MLARLFFGLLLIGTPVALAIRIQRARRDLGRSPVVLGAVGSTWERWGERLALFAMLFWPASWLWVALGRVPLSPPPVRALGLALMATGAALTAAAIFLMGRAWRIGIDPTNRTELAREGPYRWIRHPIYAGMLLMVLGNVLVAPSPMIDLAALLTTLGILRQALREEQYLHQTFGERYARYAAETGRFVPRFRVRATPTSGR